MRTRKLRLLCIGHPYAVASNRCVARELARSGEFDIAVAAPKQFRGDLRSITLEPEPNSSPLRVVGLDTMLSRAIHVFRFRATALTELIATSSFDLISAWEEPYIYAGWQIARAAKVAGTAFCFRTAQNIYKRYPPPFNLFEKQTVARADGWLACGQLVFDVMTKRGYHARRGRVIPLAVDTAAFSPLQETAKRGVLNEVGLEPPIVGFLGRLTTAKGIPVMLKALEMIPREQPWSLLCLGSGPERASIHAWARERGWEKRVRVKLVKHHEVPRYLGAVDVLVAPSQTTPRWKEQFGRMIVEAFACGVPAIGSDSGEIPHVIGEAGIIAPEADAAAWAREIEALLRNPQRREGLSRLGLERAQQFSAKILAEDYAAFYRDLWKGASDGKTNVKH
jgi:glycosyltransferase involved in cell wall biosynthesis